jgi:hypothetical protein
MHRHLFPAIGLAAGLLAAGGAGALTKWGPTWSEITGERLDRTSAHRFPGIIKSVDGRHYTDRRVKVEPGERVVVVQSPPRKGFQGTDKELRLTIEPCKRYYINAQFASGVGQDWEPVVERTEPIAGCKLEGAAK